ncbi:MAG: glycosyltransferase family 2 protein [Rhodobacteraceae bacterium]|nr:glycosyltransferase family 2 protein [Paracoccaceae bacterium]
MRLSFIITTFDVAPWVGRCLLSVAAAAAPGDQVIVVDDGSTDATPAAIAAALPALAAATGAAPEVVLLGANTWGGVGTPANLGMDRADGEALFFVDGDDWLAPDEFRLCRARFEATGDDILIANYLEFDEATGGFRQPADRLRWGRPREGLDARGRRLLALSLIAVPWRKFYRRAFVEDRGLRFPEGDFFFEDNPFHWAVCLAAETIGFADRVLCHHRVNRPGQTMAATGEELAAFFTHYRTIAAMLPAGEPELRAAAMEWLVANMAWQLPRLQPPTLSAYVREASAVVGGFDPLLWAGHGRARFAGSQVGRAVDQLLSLPAATVEGLWLAERGLAATAALRRELADLAAGLGALAGDQARTAAAVADLGHRLEALAAAAEVRALAGLARTPDAPLPPAGGGEA